MNYRDPGRAAPLSAEYALGTLRGAARRRFQKLLGRQTELRDQVDFWELRLADLGRAIAPVAPPADAWANINRMLDEHLAVGTQPWPPLPQQAPPMRRHSRRWKLAAGFAAAASLLLAFKLGQRNAESPGNPERIASASVANWEHLPMVVAKVQMPASSMAWLISLSPDRRQLTVLAAEDFLQVGRHSVELWLNSPSLGRVPLGLLPVARDASITTKLPDGLEGQSEITFMISIEPSGGSTTGEPTGPVMNSAIDRGAI